MKKHPTVSYTTPFWGLSFYCYSIIVYCYSILLYNYHWPKKRHCSIFGRRGEVWEKYFLWSGSCRRGFKLFKNFFFFLLKSFRNNILFYPQELKWYITYFESLREKKEILEEFKSPSTKWILRKVKMFSYCLWYCWAAIVFYTNYNIIKIILKTFFNPKFYF